MDAPTHPVTLGKEFSPLAIIQLEQKSAPFPSPNADRMAAEPASGNRGGVENLPSGNLGTQNWWRLLQLRPHKPRHPLWRPRLGCLSRFLSGQLSSGSWASSSLQECGLFVRGALGDPLGIQALPDMGGEAELARSQASILGMAVRGNPEV